MLVITMSCHAISWYPILCHITPCTLHHNTYCYPILCLVMSCHAFQSYVILHHVHYIIIPSVIILFIVYYCCIDNNCDKSCPQDFVHHCFIWHLVLMCKHLFFYFVDYHVCFILFLFINMNGSFRCRNCM